MKIIKPGNRAILEIADFLNNGGIVIFPTDTVYGFLADGKNRKAVNKIYKIKNRPKDKPLPVFVKNFKTAKELAEISKAQEAIVKKKWPGKFTFVLKRKKGVKLYGLEKDSIAMRIPDFKPLNDLLKKINKPLVQTSVNVSGGESLRKSKGIISQFEEKDLLFIDYGNLPKRKSSSIIDLRDDENKKIR